MNRYHFLHFVTSDRMILELDDEPYLTDFTGELHVDPPVSYRDSITINADLTSECHWFVDCGFVRWDGEKDFDDYMMWLDKLIQILTTRGHQVFGVVKFKGEMPGDRGRIVVYGNKTQLLEKYPW